MNWINFLLEIKFFFSIIDGYYDNQYYEIWFSIHFIIMTSIDYLNFFHKNWEIIFDFFFQKYK